MQMTETVIYTLMLLFRFEQCERLAEAVWEAGLGETPHPSDVRNWTDEKKT